MSELQHSKFMVNESWQRVKPQLISIAQSSIYIALWKYILSVLSLASVVHHASWYCNWNIPHLPTVCVSIMFLSTYKHILLALLVIHKHLKLKVFNHCRHTSGWDRWPSLKLLGLLISDGQFEVTEMSNWRFICVVDSFLFVGVFVFFFFTHVYP